MQEMKPPLIALVTAFVLGSHVLAGINEELVSLLNAQHVAALAPAREGRIEDKDPWAGGQTFGMHFDVGKAIPLEENSFKNALESSKIDDWTFGVAAPWSPGEKSSWVALDYAGEPFLSVRLAADQPKLVIINQVISFSEGVATLGRTRHYFFRCELSSEAFVKFLQEALKSQSIKRFVPRPDGTPAEKSASCAAEQGGTGQPATRSESKSEGIAKPQPESEGRSR
jgi:hypothetical protein